MTSDLLLIGYKSEVTSAVWTEEEVSSENSWMTFEPAPDRLHAPD